MVEEAGMMVLFIDNYDSFIYNLYQQIGQICKDIQVVRNDEITIKEIEKMPLDALVISSGPGYPKDAGISIQAIRHFNGKIPILGIGLGHQAIGEAFGGKIVPAKQYIHGGLSRLNYRPSILFAGITGMSEVVCYHSLVVERESLPNVLEPLAEDEMGQIMALKHKEYPTYGLQFHPESILTDCGRRILENFLTLIPSLSVTPLDTSLEEIPISERNALKPYLFQVIDGHDLTCEQAFQAMTYIMNGGATSDQIDSFLTALRMKGETIDEITGFTQVMRKKGKTVAHHFPVLDIVGTGGDLVNTFNISTTAAFVIAGAGMPVAKHGDRSVSSKSGAADVLEALDFRLNISPEQAQDCLEQCGISFLFAPSFHGSMKFATVPRREIAVRSILNLLKPLANPAASDYILLGVYDENVMETMANVLINLGIKGAMIVHGEDGLDEISIAAPTKVCEVQGKRLIKYTITPEEFGFSSAPLAEVMGGEAKQNALITTQILDGTEQGAKRDIVLMNAGCALYIAKKANSISQGIELAKQSIDSKRAWKRFQVLHSYLKTLED